MTARQIVASYLVLQSLATLTWWVVLLAFPESIDFFKPSSWPNEALLSFAFADLTLVIGGGLATAFLVVRKHPFAAFAVWGLSFVIAYPTLYCLLVSIMTGEAWLSTCLMSVMMGTTVSMATIHGLPRQSCSVFRVCPMSFRRSLIWTGIQLLFFWSTFLWIIPRAIVEIEASLNFPAFAHQAQPLGSTLLFAGASAVGFWSAYTMATLGRGTPLPTATAPFLVIAGPYRYVRNPMALAGITQGLAVGWWMGSFSVIVYALVGAVAWHTLVRPHEERDLLKRFGAAYRDYQRRVLLWIPMIPKSVSLQPGTKNC